MSEDAASRLSLPRAKTEKDRPDRSARPRINSGPLGMGRDRSSARLEIKLPEENGAGSPSVAPPSRIGGGPITAREDPMLSRAASAASARFELVRAMRPRSTMHSSSATALIASITAALGSSRSSRNKRGLASVRPIRPSAQAASLATVRSASSSSSPSAEMVFETGALCR
jgi:hypothetical protein